MNKQSPFWIMPTDLSTILMMQAVITGLAFAIAYFIKKENRKANIYLSIFFILVASGSIYVRQNLIKDGVTLGLYISFNFVGSLGYGPVFFMYVKQLIDPEWKFRLKHLIHFIPLLLWVPTYFLTQSIYSNSIDPTKDNVSTFLQIEKNYLRILSLVTTLGRISSIVYLLISVKMINRHENWLRSNFSNIQNKSLKGLKQLVLIIIVLWAIWNVTSIVQSFDPLKNQFTNLFSIINLIAIFAIGLAAFNIEENHYRSEIVDEEKIKSDEDFSKETAKLIKLIEGKELYLNPYLKLSDLSSELGISEKKLSRIINSGLNKSFYDLINAYRIDIAKGKLLDPKYRKLSINAVALDSGFKTISVYDTFKKFTGITPKEFKKQNTPQ